MFKTIEQWTDLYKDSGESAADFVSGRTECPLNAVELEIAAINPEALEWLAQLDEFMQPSADKFTHAEAWENMPADLDADTLADIENENLAGWYARLSAPGYLDCTDWQGPYESEAAALVALWEVYGD